MELPTGKAVTYSYDPLARLSEVGIDGIVNTSYTYESAGTGKTTPQVSSVTTNGKKTEYTHDAYGNILTITEDGVLTHSYTYDARNQLIGEVSGADTYVYNYDAGGNLQSVQKNGETVKTYAYGDESWKDLLTSFNGQAITYDAIGNPLTYRGWTLTWTGGRRLASIAGEGLTAAYTYNADGVRTQKTVNGVTTQYYLDGTSILRQVSGDDVLEFFYDTDSVLGLYYNGTPYYYLKNMQGDVVGILDSTGTQVVAYSYDAWGAPLSVTGTLADTLGQLNPFRYRSYYYDAETGLYYLNSRYYDAETGRFISVDHLIPEAGGSIKGYNLFVYCYNNPVNMFDEEGNWPNLIKRALHTAKTFVRTILSPLKAIEVKVGAGIGIGATANASVGGMNLEAEIVVKNSDSIVLNKKGIDMTNTSKAGANISVLHYTVGVEYEKGHSYSDERCTCNIFKDTFHQKMDCPANNPGFIAMQNAKLEFGVSAYLLLGIDASISIDLNEWNEELIDIFNESMEYED